MPSKSRLLSSTINKPTSLIGASIAQPDEVNLASFETASDTYATASDLPGTGIAGEQAFVTDTNRLYMWNGTGWFNIAIVNESPTWDSNGQPDAAYELDADSPQDATVITLAATDPDGLAINYSYVTSGQMDSMATISQDSSVFTITPKTEAQVGAGVELTGSITFRASDGINIIPAVSQFTLSFISIIENSKYTNLLVTADGTSDNNNITDSSSNSHAVTVNNNVTAGTFSPYRHGGYSMLFTPSGSSSHYISLPSDASFDFGSGDFTIEGWLYPLSALGDSGKPRIFMQRRVGSTSGLFEIVLNSDGTIRGGTGNVDSTTDLRNSWNHFAYVKNSGTLKLYINGTEEGSVSDTTTYSPSATPDPVIGAYYNGNIARYNGYLTDFRITKSAVYTSNFTAPAERLTAIANTSLLTCHLPYLADGSTNSHAVTPGGNIHELVPFTPYDSLEYDADTHGGSIYFTGSTADSVLGNSGTQLGAGDWTVQGWMYLEDASVDRMLIDYRPFSNGQYVTLGYQNVGGESGKMHLSVNNVDRIVSNDSLYKGHWAHIACVRNSGVIRMYINGKLQTQTYSTTATFLSASYRPVIGINGDNNSTDKMKGWISDVRADVGSAAYTAEFTPPTEPISSTGSDLHIKGTDASIVDKAQTSNVQVYGTATGSTTQVKFVGSKSMYFAGSLNDKIIAYAARDVDIPDNGAYTFEAWCYFNSVSGVIHMLSSADVTDRIAFELRNSKLAAMVGGSVIQSGSQVLSTGQWYHLAISRVTGSPYSTTRFFVNGNLDQTSTIYQQSPAIGGFNEWYIGSPTPNNLGNGYNEVTGYMQDVRFTEGLGRYTANFTPPTKSLAG